MNQHLDFQPKKQPKYSFLVILLIAIGLHLLVLSPLIAPQLILPVFERSLTQATQKSPLSIHLIYKKEELAANQINKQQPILENKLSNELDLQPVEPPASVTDQTSLNSNITNDKITNDKITNDKITNDKITNDNFNEAAIFNIDPLKNSLLDSKAPSNIDLNQEALNFTPDVNLSNDQNPTSEQFEINTNSQSFKTGELDETKAKDASLSQSLENTQTDSFSEGLESSKIDKAVLEHIFSNKTQQQLVQAEEAQTQYEDAQSEEINYAITEDSDGTRYVNIKGICWRIPPPGTEEAWTIVYAGCSGQTKTFNIEINIGMDILGPDSPLAID